MERARKGTKRSLPGSLTSVQAIHLIKDLQRFTPQFLLMRLRHSTTAQDDASEALASSFVQQLPSNIPTSVSGASRSMEVDEFIKEFKELRKVYHKRAMWGEKWGNGQVIWREE